VQNIHTSLSQSKEEEQTASNQQIQVRKEEYKGITNEVDLKKTIRSISSKK